MSALAALFAEHGTWLRNWLAWRLQNPTEAEDLAQDTFTKLLSRSQFDTRWATKAYLKTIANGLVIDLWRRKQPEQAWLDALRLQPEDHAPSCELQAMRLETLKQLDRVLSRLAPKLVQAFVGSRVLGYTDVELAQQLGVSDRMVRHYVAEVMAELVLAQLGAEAL
jgi:RNA polymerase sigma-70 factor (ECF subfamily)